MDHQSHTREDACAVLWRECLTPLQAHFQKNVELGGFVLDFYCADAKLAVETVQNGAHNDYSRSEYLRNLGIEVLHFTKSDVETMPDTVRHVISGALQAHGCL